MNDSKKNNVKHKEYHYDLFSEKFPALFIQKYGLNKGGLKQGAH